MMLSSLISFQNQLLKAKRELNYKHEAMLDLLIELTTGRDE